MKRTASTGVFAISNKFSSDFFLGFSLLHTMGPKNVLAHILIFYILKFHKVFLFLEIRLVHLYFDNITLLQEQIRSSWWIFFKKVCFDKILLLILFSFDFFDLVFNSFCNKVSILVEMNMFINTYKHVKSWESINFWFDFIKNLALLFLNQAFSSACWGNEKNGGRTTSLLISQKNDFTIHKICVCNALKGTNAHNARAKSVHIR